MSSSRLPDFIAHQYASSLHPDIKAAAAEQVEKKRYRAKFTLDNLQKHSDFFKEYCKINGDEKPIKTSNTAINTYGNWFISCVPFSRHVVRTNQPYAKKAYDAILQAERETKKISNRENEYVLSALLALQTIYKTMCDEKATGTVKSRIEDTIKAFDLPLDEEQFGEKYTRIAKRL